MNLKFFEDINPNDLVGGKGANLAKMFQIGLNVPYGFVIDGDLFDEYLLNNNVYDKIKNLLLNCKIDSLKEIDQTSEEIILILSHCKMPKKIEKQILAFFKKLDCKFVAVRSSASSEDGKVHTWAGTLESFLNVNENNIIECVQKCWFSVFKPRALFYMIKNEEQENISVAVIVQKMIQSDISGVAFSINPVNNNDNELMIEAVYGLGEAVVSGVVTPDIYIVNKENDKIIKKQIKNQKKKMNLENGWIDVQEGNLQKLEDEKILELTELIRKVELFYGFPVDVEWGIKNNIIYILQCRPITTIKENFLLKNIKNQGNWKYYVSRKYNWFVENTEIYASNAEYQNKLLGFNLETLNFLCLNGDEYALESDSNILFNKLDNYFEKDSKFFQKFTSIEFDLCKKINKHIDYLQSVKWNTISFKNLIKEFEVFNKLYIDSFIPGMTRPDEYLTYKLKKELTALNFDTQSIEDIFLNISSCPNYFPLSYSEEPLDLLKIAKHARNNEDINKLLENHTKKYSWIKGPVKFEETAFTKKDYLERIDSLIDTDISNKIDNIQSSRRLSDISYENVLEKYKFPENIRKLIQAIRDFIFLRTYTTESTDHLFFVGRHTIFKEIANRLNIPLLDLIMLNDKEILEILNTGILSQNKKDEIENRKKGFGIIWLNSNVDIVFGNESLELQYEIAQMYKKTNNEIIEKNKNIILGSVANKGKIIGPAKILKNDSDIYKVNNGDIIVASMTTPNYISAMEKASGFITDEGGITCHAAILSREFNVPCIVGTLNATELIKDGETIELNAYTGKISKIN